MAALFHHHHHSKISPHSLYINTPTRFLSVNFLILHIISTTSLCVRVQNPSILEFSSISLLLLPLKFHRVYRANNGSFYRLWRLNGLAFVGASVRQWSRQHLSWIGIKFFLFFLDHWFGFCFLFLSFVFRFELVYTKCRISESMSDSYSDRVNWIGKLYAITIRKFFLLLCFLLWRFFYLFFLIIFRLAEGWKSVDRKKNFSFLFFTLMPYFITFLFINIFERKKSTIGLNK